MSADLHIHTTFSDGTSTPEEVVKLAKEAGLTTIAITDHDDVDGIDEAIAFGKENAVEVIPGVEFTTEVPDNEIHILGYYIDYKDETFLTVLKKIRDDRTQRIYKIVEKLNKLNINISADDVLKVEHKGAVGRPHVARVLVEKGIVKDFKEAFTKYLYFEGPAYVPHYKLSPQEAVKLILNTKGVPVYAHPGVTGSDEMITDLMTVGLMGIEVFYSGHSREREQHYLTLARKNNLLVTGGSDFHGLKSDRESILGGIRVADKFIVKLKEAAKCTT